jgi:hypothetical protein
VDDYVKVKEIPLVLMWVGGTGGVGFIDKKDIKQIGFGASLGG